MREVRTQIRRLADLAFTPVNAIHSDWLKPLLSAYDQLASRVLENRTAARLLNGMVREHYGITVPERSSLAPSQRWLLADTEAQRLLALSLGAAGCASFIKRTVERAQVAEVRRAIGADRHEEILTNPGIRVSNLAEDDYRTALSGRALGDYLTGIGITMLERTVEDHDAFFLKRMRFAFSKASWNGRVRELDVDLRQVADFIVDRCGES